MSSQVDTDQKRKYGVSLKALIPMGLLILSVFVAVRTFKQNEILMSGTEEYSLRGLIKAHGYSSSDMLGPVPLELPILVDYMYRGRNLVVDDPLLFSSKVVGVELKPNDTKRPAVPPALADTWRRLAVRQLVYNPFSYSEQAKLGEPLPRTSWPTLIRLLAPAKSGDARARVVITEVDGVVYFVPSELFDLPTAATGPSLDDKMMEPLLVALLWLTGWSFVRWACGSRAGLVQSIGFGLPVGVGLWSVFYWGSRSLLGRSLVLGSPGVIFGLFCVVLLLPIFFLSKTFRSDLRRLTPLLLVILAALITLTLGLARAGSFIPTFDSFRLLSSENSPAQSLALGFPVVLSAVAVLGAVTGNGFFGAIFSLLFISLVIITSAAFHRFESLYPSRAFSKLVALLLLVLLFALTPMSRLQFSYVNGHVFHASCLLMLVVCLLESRSVDFEPPNKIGYSLLVFLLAVLVSMSRMEGSLILVVLLASLLFSGLRQGPLAGRNLPLVVALGVVVWGGVTGLVLDSKAFVSSIQYVFLSALAGLLGLTSLCDPTSPVHRILAKYGVRLMLLGSAIVLYAAHVLKPDHMGVSSYSVMVNLFSYSEGWGYFWWFAVASAVSLFWVVPRREAPVDSIRDGLHQQSQTVLLSFFMLAVIATIAIGLFRIPYRVGWSDSANRIMFQLAPVFLVWLYGAIGVAMAATRTRRAQSA